MVDKTVFGSTNEPSPTSDTDNQAQPAVPTTIENEYIGQGKKYATAEIALASIAPSQHHIKTLEEELVETRKANEALLSDLQKRETAEEIISRINSNQQEGSQTSNAPTVDLESIKQIAAQAAQETLSAKAKEAQLVANEKLVSDRLVAEYGDSAVGVLEDKAKELGMSVEDMRNLSQSSPKVVLAMFDKYKPIDQVPSKTSGSSTVRIPTPTIERKGVMGAATTAELNAEWRRCKDLTS